MISGIYKIQSKKKPERIYVGSSSDIPKRWSAHKKGLLRNAHFNKKLQNHVNKYGLDDLEFAIIAGCDIDTMLDYEQFYIDALNPWFNIAPRAGVARPRGSALSEDHKRKISEAQMGEKNSMYGKPSPNKKGGKGYPSPFKGKKGRYSEETLQRMRESNQRAWNKRKQKQKEELCPQ